MIRSPIRVSGEVRYPKKPDLSGVTHRTRHKVCLSQLGLDNQQVLVTGGDAVRSAMDRAQELISPGS